MPPPGPSAGAVLLVMAAVPVGIAALAAAAIAATDPRFAARINKKFFKVVRIL